MNSATSLWLRYAVSDDDALRALIVELTRMFHVVPSAVADSEAPVLAVEVDADYPDLVEEVRRVVVETDPAAQEMHAQPT